MCWAASLVLTGVNQVYGLSIFALNLVIGMGLGLAIDYTLFLVTRYREELARRGETADAIGVTMARAGRTVLFSAATVACALATPTLFPQGFLKSMGLAGAVTAIVAAIAAVTISPALLGLWGAKLERPGGRAGESGRWYRFARAVMRRPGAIAAATALVRQVRATPAPFETKVTGDAATFVDQQAAIGSHLPEAIAVLAGLTFIVLWLMTDSLVLPIKAIVMNALIVGASLTSLTLIYQHGRLTSLLGYTPNGGVEPTDFVVAATVVFALSTDYGVFLLGRIKEARESDSTHPADNREAVAIGLGATGRVITAAAILLAVAIGAFSTSSIPFIQEIGVATATGVLLDAFVVRSLLVPSLMALLGDWNWWSPRSVRRVRGWIVPRDPGEPADQPAERAGAGV